MTNQTLPLDWFLPPNPWAPWLPDVMLSHARATPPLAPTWVAPSIDPWDQSDSSRGHLGDADRVEVPKRRLLSSWLDSVQPSGDNGGILGRLSLPVEQPWDDPWPNNVGAPGWMAPKLPIAPARPPTFPTTLPPSHTSALGTPASDLYLLPVPPAPSWDAGPAHATPASATQIFPQPPSPSSWGEPAREVNAAASSPVDELPAARDAFEAAAERLRRGVRGRVTAPYELAAPDPEAEAGESGLIERIRLNGVDAFYRGTLMGAGRLALMQHYASTPEELGIDPPSTRWRDQLRKDYPHVLADLASYDRMGGFGNPSELAAAAVGQVGGGLPTPESLIGVGAKGASMLWRLAKAGLQQGAVSAAIDPVVQALNMKAGVQDEYDPVRTGVASATGFVTGAAAKSSAEALSQRGRGATGPGGWELSPQEQVRRELYKSAHNILQGLEPQNPHLHSFRSQAWLPAFQDIDLLRAEIARVRSERRLSDLELHHVYPLQFLDRFERVGIDPEDYMVYLYQSQHRLRPHGLHTGSNNWNAQWAQFFKKNENQSADLIAEQLINMFKQLAK